jgi:hypothetical protein
MLGLEVYFSSYYCKGLLPSLFQKKKGEKKNEAGKYFCFVVPIHEIQILMLDIIFHFKFNNLRILDPSLDVL